VKIPLTKETLTADDLAYYTEYYVHKEKYKDHYEHNKNRFYVKMFQSVKQSGGKAEVFFTVLDFRKKSDFDDSMTFVRNRDGLWSHVDDGGKEIAAVYTYVPKFAYYSGKYAWSGFGAGLILFGGLLAFRRLRKRTGHSPEKGRTEVCD
jgi:hypothetical protein